MKIVLIVCLFPTTMFVFLVKKFSKSDFFSNFYPVLGLKLGKNLKNDLIWQISLLKIRTLLWETDKLSKTIFLSIHSMNIFLRCHGMEVGCVVQRKRQKRSSH